MTDVGDIFDNDDFFGDIVDTPKEGTEQHKKRGCLKDVKELRLDIENDSIIKGQMAGLGCLFVCVFGNYLALVLIATHTANNLDFGDGQDHGDEGHESD